MHQNKSMDPKTPINQYRYGGKLMSVKAHPWMQDNGLLFSDGNELYVSSEYFYRLQTNFDVAIMENTRMILLDDPTLSFNDCKEALRFTTKLIDYTEDVNTRHKMGTYRSLINIQVRSLEEDIH